MNNVVCRTYKKNMCSTMIIENVWSTHCVSMTYIITLLTMSYIVLYGYKMYQNNIISFKSLLNSSLLGN